jgi:hypothetical protein
VEGKTDFVKEEAEILESEFHLATRVKLIFSRVELSEPIACLVQVAVRRGKKVVLSIRSARYNGSVTVFVVFLQFLHEWKIVNRAHSFRPRTMTARRGGGESR